MIDYHFDPSKALLQVHPTGPLSKTDFDRLAAEIDPYIEQSGDLAGLILEFKRFPNWENFAAALSHFRFVRDHHRHIRKIAIVTDSPIGNLAEHIGAHFISAEVRHFTGNETDRAQIWIVGA